MNIVFLKRILLALAAGLVAVAQGPKQRRAREQQNTDALEEKIRKRTAAQALYVKITAALQGASTLEELARAFLRHAVPETGAQFAAFYVVNEDSGQLELMGGYGAAPSDGMKRAFAMGDGMVGQCALDKQPATIYKVPDTATRIVSGIGNAKPRQLLLQALVQKNKVVGALEFATLQAFADTATEFLDEVMPTLAMSIEILDRSLRTQALLDAKRVQAAQLEHQQRELQESNARRDAANQALQAQVEELAAARRSMLNIMEDLEMARAAEIASDSATRTSSVANEVMKGTP